GQVAVCLSCGTAVPPPGLPPRAGGGVDGGALLPPPLAGEGWGGGRLPCACHAGPRCPPPGLPPRAGGGADGRAGPSPRVRGRGGLRNGKSRPRSSGGRLGQDDQVRRITSTGSPAGPG